MKSLTFSMIYSPIISRADIPRMVKRPFPVNPAVPIGNNTLAEPRFLGKPVFSSKLQSVPHDLRKIDSR
jgi:hypothetical protein